VRHFFGQDDAVLRLDAATGKVVRQIAVPGLVSLRQLAPGPEHPLPASSGRGAVGEPVRAATWSRYARIWLSSRCGTGFTANAYGLLPIGYAAAAIFAVVTVTAWRVLRAERSASAVGFVSEGQH
jgi:hypothetical protein